jgi:hypothetical protein
VTVDDDLPELERAVDALAKVLPDEDQPDQDATSEAASGDEPPVNPPSEA